MNEVLIKKGLCHINLNYDYHNCLRENKEKKKRNSTGNTVSDLDFFIFPTSQYCVLFLGRVKDHKALEVRASTLRGDLRMLRAELTQLKQFQTFQAQQFDEMIQRAKEQIVQRVAQTNSGELVNLSLAIC